MHRIKFWWSWVREIFFCGCFWLIATFVDYLFFKVREKSSSKRRIRFQFYPYLEWSITNLSSNLFQQIKLIFCKEGRFCSPKLYTSENISTQSHKRFLRPLLPHFADFNQECVIEHIPTMTTLEATRKQCS